MDICYKDIIKSLQQAIAQEKTQVPTENLSHWEGRFPLLSRLKQEPGEYFLVKEEDFQQDLPKSPLLEMFSWIRPIYVTKFTTFPQVSQEAGVKFFRMLHKWSPLPQGDDFFALLYLATLYGLEPAWLPKAGDLPDISTMELALKEKVLDINRKIHQEMEERACVPQDYFDGGTHHTTLVSPIERMALKLQGMGKLSLEECYGYYLFSLVEMRGSADLPLENATKEDFTLEMGYVSALEPGTVAYFLFATAYERLCQEG